MPAPISIECFAARPLLGAIHVRGKVPRWRFSPRVWAGLRELVELGTTARVVVAIGRGLPGNAFTANDRAIAARNAVHESPMGGKERKELVELILLCRRAGRRCG